MLSNYEKEHGKFSISNLIKHFEIDMVLCNNITSMDIYCINELKCIDIDDVETWINEYYPELLIDEFEVESFNDLTDDDIEDIINDYGYDIMNDLGIYTDVYQYFIINECDVEYLENDYPIFYCDELDLYIVGITHFGMSWSMIYTTVDIPQYMLSE